MAEDTQKANAKKHSCPRCGYFDPYVQAFQSAEDREALAAKPQDTKTPEASTPASNTPEVAADDVEEAGVKPADEATEETEPKEAETTKEVGTEAEIEEGKPAGLTSVVTVGNAA